MAVGGEVARSPGPLAQEAGEAAWASNRRVSTTVELAVDARDRGQAALAAGDSATALRWLDRAGRLFPGDRTLTLLRAAASIAVAPDRAAALFEQVAQADDIREAWTGLAGVRLRLGDLQGAAAALAQALQRHAPDQGLVGPNGIADQIARAAGAPGWCGLRGDGMVVFRATAQGQVTLALDGAACTGMTLPPGWHEARSLVVRLGRRPLIGSPIDIAAIRRCSGFVQAEAGGLRGWAWHPNDPDSRMRLLVRPAEGRQTLSVLADQPVDDVQGAGTLGRPWGFAIPAEALAGMPGLLHVLGPDGRDLTGSPLDPAVEQRAATAAATALALLYPATRANGKPAVKRVMPVPPAAVPADVMGRRP
ncbi:MAG TPA: hypothetical protein VFN46_10835, partial [Acetobacteraceae bacterium]|nr:hypothetical protein [Acetobacteraceae bacterium]